MEKPLLKVLEKADYIIDSPYEDDNNVIGMDISKLRTVPRSIGIAGGIEKLRAIRGAINGHYINTLITDIQCAEALISE